jgi:acyl carrier protein
MNDHLSATPPTQWPPMPQEGMIERILDIVEKEANIDRALLVPGATMESLQIPSFDMVMILIEIEEAFNAYLPMGEELADTVYLHDLIQVLTAKMQSKDSAPGTGASQA